MKKLISMLAIFAMVLSITTSVIPTAFAEDTANEVTDSDAVALATYLPSSVTVQSGANAAAIATPVYGMETYDGVMKYTPRNKTAEEIATTPALAYYYASMIYNSNDLKNVITAAATAREYVVFETDFAGEDILEIVLTRGSNQTVSKPLTSGWTENRWNTARVVYEAPTTTYKNGRTALYLNGEVAMDFTANSNALNEARFCFKFNNNEGTLYVKNYRMYTSDTNPGAAGTAIDAALTNTNLDIQGSGLIVAPQNVTVSALTANGAEIRVYSDSTFAAPLAGDAILSAGNVVVLEKDGMLGYYDVVDTAMTVIYDDSTQPSWSNSAINNKTTVTGYGGKDATDESLHWNLNSTAAAGSEAGSAQLVYPLSYHYRYIVAKVNFYLDSGSSYRFFRVTTGGNYQSVSISSAREGEWNNMILLIDTKETKAKAYLNGEMIQDWTEKNGQFLSDDTNPDKKQFRFNVGAANKAGFAIDDFEMYTTTHLPENEEDVMDKDFKKISGTHTTSNNRVFYKAGATVSELLADSKYNAEGATSVIYDAATGATHTTGAMPADARLAVRTNDNTIMTYRLIAADGIFAWVNTTTSRAAVAFAEEGVMIAAVYDANGRFLEMAKPEEIEDGVVKAAVKWADGQTVKFMLWDSLTGMKPVYDSKEIN